MLQEPVGMHIASAPQTCTADIIGRTSWGVATAAYQVTRTQLDTDDGSSY